jgi:hypothetical protein
MIIAVAPAPAKPTITQGNDNELISSSLTGNQWFNESVAIDGATDPVYSPPAQGGNYRVQATINGCASVISDPFHYPSPGGGDAVRLYPNPVENWLRIVFDFPDVDAVTVVLYNLRGEKILEKRNVRCGSMLSLAAYAPGNYILRLVNPANNKVLSSQQVIKR